jgi:hypothetical protein
MSISLDILDMLGKKISSIISFTPHTKGSFSQEFSAHNIADGSYIVQIKGIKANGQVFTRSRIITVLK